MRPSTGNNSKLLSNFHDFQPFGSGSFGKVCKAKKRLFNDFDFINVLPRDKYKLEEHFAVKLIERFGYEDVLNEVEFLSMLIHPNIIACYNIWEESRDACGDDEWEKSINFKR